MLTLLHNLVPVIVVLALTVEFALADDVGYHRTTRRPSHHTPPYRRDTDTQLKVLVLLASVRPGRMADRVAKYVQVKLEEVGDHVELIDPRDIDLPMLERPLHFYVNEDDVPDQLKRLNDKIKSADAYVIVTPEYNRQLPPALLNLIDHIPPRSFAFKSSGVVAYSVGSGGTFGGANARSLMVDLGAPPIPFLLHIPYVDTFLDRYGQSNNTKLDEGMSKFMLQFQWFAKAIQRYRISEGEPNWIESVVSMM